MLKSKKVLAIFSSIFGVFTICTLFCFNLLFDNTKKVVSVSAEDVTVQSVRNNNINLYYYPDIIQTIEGVDTRIILSPDESTNPLYPLFVYRDVMNFDYGSALSKSINGASELYRVFFAFDINLSTYYGGNEVPSTSVHLYDLQGNYTPVVATDYLTDVSSFIFELELHSFTLESTYVEKFPTTASYFNVSFRIRFDLRNVITGNVVGSMSFDGDFGEGGHFKPYVYGDGDMTLGYQLAQFASLTMVTSFTFNALPEEVAPTRSNLLVNRYEFDAMASEYSQGYSIGYNAGIQEGYVQGDTAGYNNGYGVGYAEGVASQIPQINLSYQNGYNDGFEDGNITDSTVATVFSGILQIGLIPINFLLNMLNFEILGINMSAFVSALLSVCLTIIIIRLVVGSKPGGSDGGK